MDPRTASLLVLLFSVLLTFGFVSERIRRRRAEDALKASETRITAVERTLAARLTKGYEEERRRVARELHDGLSQEIALLNINIDMMAAEVPGHRSQLTELSSQVGTISRDLQHLVHELHPTRLQTLGLAECLRRLCHDVSQQGRVHVGFTNTGVPAAINPNVSLCVYRIAQEALRNVVNHSRARQASMRLGYLGSEVSLHIADSGVGFDAAALRSGGYGLANMKERGAALKGRVTIDSRRGEGTRISVSIPSTPSRHVPARSAGRAELRSLRRQLA